MNVRMFAGQERDIEPAEDAAIAIAARGNDRVLQETRWLAAFIVPFLVVAFVLLYLLPADTDRLFAWTIHPDMTALMMGAGYISGSYFFVQVFRARKWHTVHLGFLPITAFTLFMAIATFMHLDRFHQGHVALYAESPTLEGTRPYASSVWQP